MRLKSVLILLSALQWIMAALTPVSTAATDNLEYKLKAAFLLNFAKFTSWPDISTPQPSFPLCVLGGENMQSAFSGLEKKNVAGAPVNLRLLDDIPEHGECRLLFVSSAENKNISRIVEALPAEPILVVSDIRGSANEGGVIEFIYLENRLRFIINHSEAKRRGLEISSSLLSLAHSVL